MPCTACGQVLPEEAAFCWRCGARLDETARAPVERQAATPQYKEVALKYTGRVIEYLATGKGHLPGTYGRRKFKAEARAREFVMEAISAELSAGWMFHGSYDAAVDENWANSAMLGRPRFRGARVRLYRLT